MNKSLLLACAGLLIMLPACEPWWRCCRDKDDCAEVRHCRHCGDREGGCRRCNKVHDDCDGRSCRRRGCDDGSCPREVTKTARKSRRVVRDYDDSY